MGHIYSQIPSENISDTIWDNRDSSAVDPKTGKLFHPTAHLIVRFARDVESNCMVGSHGDGLQSRLCAKTLRDFFECNASSVRYRDEGDTGWFPKPWERPEYLVATDSNLIAQWANSGCIKRVVIRDHTLQSVTYLPFQIVRPPGRRAYHPVQDSRSNVRSPRRSFDGRPLLRAPQEPLRSWVDEG